MKKEFFENEIGEAYVKATLDNGLKIFILEKPQYKSAYALFGTKYGSIDTIFNVNGKETAVPEGIAHFLEHKLFESEDGDAFTKFAKTGAYANAFTSFDKTCYLFSCSDRFYENLDILLSFVQSPYFTEATVKKEQGIIGQEIRMYDDSPAWRVMFNMLMAMYHNHPVRIDIAGTVESIAKIDYKLLFDCYNTFYNPSNMFICIAGNVDADTCLEQIERGIKPSKPHEIMRIKPKEPYEVVTNYTEQSLEVAQPMFCFGFKQEVDETPLTVKEKIIIAMLLNIISGDASPLYKELINKGLINDEFESEHFCGDGYSALIFEGESSDPKAVAKEIKNEIGRLKRDGIDKKLFSAIRASMYGSAIRMFNNVESIAMSLTDCAMNDTSLFDELKYLRSITLEDVSRKLKCFDTENTVLSVINPK
ncbi:MAG: insulinase family protein [Clostridia bacterium]|nr:insulinase family protein [Clostridia bacterium]